MMFWDFAYIVSIYLIYISYLCIVYIVYIHIYDIYQLRHGHRGGVGCMLQGFALTRTSCKISGLGARMRLFYL